MHKLFLVLIICVLSIAAWGQVDDTPYYRWPKIGTADDGISYRIIEFQSKTGERLPQIAKNRTKMSAIHWYMSNSKGVIISLYGGGCLSNNFPGTYQLDQLNRFFLAKDYEVVLLDYKEHYNLRTNSYAYPEEKRAEYCELAARDQVVEIQSALEEFNAVYNTDGMPVFLYGHSYGGFLVNHIMTGARNHGVSGYISSHGIWDNSKMSLQQVGSVVPASFRPIDNPSLLNAPALIFQSTQDYQVSFESFLPFYSWSASIPKDNYRLILFDGANHFLDSEFFETHPRFEAEIDLFLKKHSLQRTSGRDD